MICERGTPALREAAAAEWRHRWSFELQAAARFRRLSHTLKQLGAHEAVITQAADAAVDEARHATQCEALIGYFGHTAGEAPTFEDRPAAPSGLSARERLTYELVAMSCITESLSCALLGELVERATDTHTKKEMHSILKDEVGHSRLGWAYLASEESKGPHHFIADYLPAMLSATVPPSLFTPRPEHPLESDLSGLGALEHAERRRIFIASMREIVFPGLEHFGIDTAAAHAWLAPRADISP